jgi:hypothetical protein
MADTAVTLRFAAKPKKTTLEREFDRAEAQRERNGRIAAKREEKRKAREERTKVRSEAAVLRELLSVFRKKQPLTIRKTEWETKPQARFTFRGTEYRIAFAKWHRGGDTADVDDYRTDHEGWRLYIGQHDWEGRELFEIERYTPSPSLKPTPEAFARTITRLLRELQDEEQRNFTRRNYNHNDI